MKTTTHATRTNFQRNMEFYARDLATRELTGTAAWVIGVELKAIADAYDISNLSPEFLINELKLTKSHLYRAQNWSNFRRAQTNIVIQIIEVLIARKEKVGA